MQPLFLDLSGRLVVVIGGGAVGRRKAGTLLGSGASVRLVCLEPRPADQVHGRLDWLTEAYRPEHLSGAALVFAAATPAINQLVVDDARSRGLWVNSASDPQSGNFVMPATVRRGDFVLAVGTGGAAPALTRNVRRRLEEQFDESFGRWVALLSEVRPIILDRIQDEAQRRGLLEQLSGWDWHERLRHDDEATVKAAMLAEVYGLARNSGLSL